MLTDSIKKTEQLLPEENKSVEEKKYECTHSPQCPKLSQNVVNPPAGGYFSGHAEGLCLNLGVWFRKTTKGMRPKSRRLMRR